MEQSYICPEEVPREAFVVRDRKWVRVAMKTLGIVCCCFSVGLLSVLTLGMAVGTREPGDWQMYLGFLVLLGAILFEGVFSLRYARRRLVVEGESLSYVPTFGKVRTFRWTDIAFVKITVRGRRLCGREGQVLCRFEDNQMDSDRLLQALRTRNIGLRA